MTAEQRADRRNYIGGTDAAAVLGLSRYKTPLGLWSEKTGAIVTKDRGGELPVKLGERLEDVVAELFTEETGIKVRRVREVQIDEEHPFLRAQIDRLTVGTDELLECKTASGFKAGEWEGEDVPSEYILQVLHQLMVTKKKRGYLACLIGGNVDFVIKNIERDEDMIAELRAKEVHFWNEFVLKKVMPKVTSHDALTLMALFPNGREDVEPMTLPDGMDHVVERIKEIGTEDSGLIGDLTAEQDALKNELRLLLGETTMGVIGKWKVTWKNQSNTRIDVKRISAEAPEIYARFAVSSPSRVLRIASTEKKPKAAK